MEATILHHQDLTILPSAAAPLLPNAIILSISGVWFGLQPTTLFHNNHHRAQQTGHSPTFAGILTLQQQRIFIDLQRIPIQSPVSIHLLAMSALAQENLTRTPRIRTPAQLLEHLRQFHIPTRPHAQTATAMATQRTLITITANTLLLGVINSPKVVVDLPRIVVDLPTVVIVATVGPRTIRTVVALPHLRKPR